MALYAANNINTAVNNFEDRGYASVKGIILNRRNLENEREKVEEFAKANNLEIIADIPRCHDINHFEDLGQTVIEGDINLPISQTYIELAKRLLSE
jgi:nitrogenase iron protein NifH